MTVSEYLQKKRQDNPDFSTLSDFSLYNKLQAEDDPNLPILQIGGAQTTSPKTTGQKSYQRKVNPDSVNSFFDWTDLGINDDSAEWAKSAYNSSITGLAYQMYNGEQRFNLDGYNPGMVSDIFSSVLSFMMPMDFATMFVGGALGRGMTSLAGYGMKTAATENLVKLGGVQAAKKAATKKATAEVSEEIASRSLLAKVQAELMVKEGGYSALMQSFAPKTAGAIAQGATLATFEGVRGGMSAAVNDEDIWEGIGHGVMHGGIMGGVAGAVGASLNIKNAKLWNKAKKGPLTPKEARQASFWRTGKGGQVLAEAGVFTAPEIKNLIADEDYSMRDLFKAFGTNAGMMGVLKVQHYGQKKLWDSGKESLKEYFGKEGKSEAELADKTNEAIKSVKEDMNTDTSVNTAKQETSLKEMKKEVDRFEQNQLDKTNVKKEDYKNWEKDFDQATKDLERWEKGEIELKPERLHNIYSQIQKVYGAMKKNINKYKKDNPEITEAREAKLKEKELLADKWKTEIIDKINKIEAVKRENKKYTQKEIIDKKDKAKQTFSEAWEKANETQRKNLRQGLEDKISETGEIKDATDFELIQKRADTLLEIKREKPTTEVTEPKDKREVNKKEFEKEFDENINVDSLTDIAAENAAKGDKARGKADKLLEVDKNMQNEKYGDTPEVSKAYDTSKKIIGYIHRQIFRKGGLSGASTELNKLVKFAKDMANEGKSLFEISNKDIINFINTHKPKQETLVKLIKGFRQIRRTAEVKDSELFKFSKKFDLLKAEDIVREVQTLMGKLKEGGGEGLQLPDAPTSGFNIGKGQMNIPTKKGSKIKYITQKLQDMFRSLIQIAKGKPSQAGHEKYLIRNLDGTALTTAEVTALTIKFFKKKNFEDLTYGEARLFRNAIEQWAVSKTKINSPELKKLIKDKVIEVKDISDIVDKIIVGHGTRESMKETYAFAKDIPTTKKVVKAIIKEYMADIVNPNIKTTTSGKGYSIQEIRAGLEKLKNHKGDITYKDRNGNTKTIDKATVEAMFQYMLESGPRLNEIAPDAETLGFSEKYASKESAKIDRQLLSEAKTAESLVKASELVDQVKWVKKKFPNLVVEIHKTLGKHRGDYVLGQIQGHLIKIAKGKARIDTLPHEVAHHVVDVLKSMGDPFSKKLVKDGIKMFKGEEAFVEALGKYVSKQLPKSKIGRMKSWISRTWNHFKQYFGLTNQRDVTKMQKELVSIIGGKVLSGKIPTDTMPLASRIKIKYQKSDTEAGKKLVKKAKDNVLDIEKQLMKEEGFTKEELRELGENIIGNREWDKLDVSAIERYQERLNILAGNIIKGESKNSSLNKAKVEEIETRYDVTVEKRDNFFKEVYNTTLDKANNIQIKSYKSYVIKGKEIKPLTDTAVDAALTLIENKKIPSIGMFGRAFMTTADVIYKYGGKPGKVIAEKLLSHDATRSFYKGEGEVVTRAIEKIVDKKTRNNYMHMLDKELALGALKDIKKLHKDFAKNNSKERNPWTKELNNTIEAIENFSKGGKYFEARQLWESISKFYWKSLVKEISLNTKGNREFQQIKNALNKKFISQYFARKVTREALTHINKESPQIERLVKENIKKLTENDLKKAAKSLQITKKENPLEYKELMEGKGKALENLIAEELISMMEFGPAKVKPAFLKDRGAQLPEFMEVNVEGRKKLIRTYETNLDGTIGSYVNGMSKYLATIKYFPEFTELKGKFSLGGDAKLKNLELMSKSDTMGAYAAETIRRQLGLDFSAKDVLMNPALDIAGRLTNLSAVMGLSSPMAGVKNIWIQIPRSVAIYGTRNTVRAISFAIKTLKDPTGKMFEDAMRRGEIGYGTRELIRKESPKIKWWFDNVNLMTRTENFNRIVLAEAGRMHFAELTNVARGMKSMFHPQGKPAEVMRMFKETWKMSDADIKFIMEGKNIEGTVRYEKILQRVGFESHKSGAGATGVADLPLWFSNKYVKPLTLFQRMATSVTIDSYKNYVKPLKNGNISPLLKAALGHGLTGAALFAFYDKFMGQQIPEEESPAIDRAISYLWKGEFLGMFGELISPYDKGLSNPIMEPVLVRNGKALWSEVSQVLGYGKGADQAVKDLFLKSVVIAGQAERIFNNINQPYVTNYKRAKTLRRKFNEKMGYDTPQGNFVSKRQPYYYKLKTAIMFGKSEEEIARSYWAAFNYIVTDYENKGWDSKSVREKMARESIDAVIRHMHPINMPDSSKGRVDSKRNEFLNYLSKDNKDLMLKLEKEFKYKERAFYKIIRNNKWKRSNSVYPN